MKNYTINHGETSLTVSTLGAEVHSFKTNNREYIWQRDEKYWGGSAPVLFPIVGELKGAGKTALIDGKRYNITLHGFAGSSEFEVSELCDDSITLTLKSNDETLRKYPYKFTFSVKYTVFENKYTQSFIIKNENDTDMPYVVGAHPGFNLPMADGDVFEDYTLQFEKAEYVPALRINKDGLIDEKNNEDMFRGKAELPVSHDLFVNGAIIMEHLNSRSVRLVNKNGNGVKVDFPNFDYLGFWHMKNTDAPYLCIEPWTGMNDTVDCDEIYKNKRGMRFIAPYGETVLTLGVTVI